jgi:hypothetical protein
LEPIAEGIKWYWTVGGILVFGAVLYLAVRWIRDEGKGRVANWLREKWPGKEK